MDRFCRPLAFSLHQRHGKSFLLHREDMQCLGSYRVSMARAHLQLKARCKFVAAVPSTSGLMNLWSLYVWRKEHVLLPWLQVPCMSVWSLPLPLVKPLVNTAAPYCIWISRPSTT